MKVAASLVILAGSLDAQKKLFRAPKGFDEDGNKINGQHPKRRLQALNKFMCKWAADFLPEGKAGRFCDRYTTMIFRLDDTFGRDQCKFFDPSVKHGGPNPDADMAGMREAKNPNAKAPTKPRRLRRQADNYDACDGKSEAECNNEAMDGLECSAEDMLETSEMYAFCKPDESTNSNAVGERSMSQPNRKLKRYSAGLAKWCQRYISECYGQRVHKHCVNRAKNFLTKLALSDE